MSGEEEFTNEEEEDEEEINQPEELEKKVNDLEKIVNYLGNGITRQRDTYIRPINLPPGISLTGGVNDVWKNIVDCIIESSQ